MIRICNIIAELCSEIIRSCPDDSLFVKYSCLSLKRRNEMLKDISENVSLLFTVTSENEDKTLHIRQLKESDLNDVFYAELEEYISALQNKTDPFSMIALVQVMDESCDIMVFPEMLGNSETENYVRQRILSLTPEKQRKMPSLIILPSAVNNK